MSPLVSIIMPAYNAEEHISEAICSLLSQTFKAWEVIITDDCSQDNTCKIVQQFANNDNRIILNELKVNSGAANARNSSLKLARGRYIAYLDADDIWYPDKLKVQIEFMKRHNCAFSCASYNVIGEDGHFLGKKVFMLKKCNYQDFLTHNLLQTVGIMVDTNYVDKSLLIMPNLRRRQDAATWLQILKAGYTCFGIQDILCGYRRVSGSLF